MSLPPEQTILLNSGHSMPLIGLGTSRLEEGVGAVELALDVGYRHIDCAFMYLNESDVGDNIHRWINKGAGKREDLFITSKLPPNAMRPEDVEKFLRLSLENLKLEYLDLYLVHVTFGFHKNSNDHDIFPNDENGQPNLDYGTDLIAIWKKMESMVDAGLARSIGVSNYSIKQLKKTLAIARIPPAVVQVELHVKYQQPEKVKFCQDNNIAVTSYGSLGSPGRKSQPFGCPKFIDLLGDPVVRLVANNHSVSAAQVLLKFLVQQNIAVIPKSVNRERLVMNSKLFGWALSDTEMAALTSLHIGNQGRLFVDPKDSKIRLHPEYIEFR